MNQHSRINFLDNFRAFTVLLVVVLHGSTIYMSYPPKWWNVVDNQTSLFFSALTLLVAVPIMPIMFFLAAYFTPSSLAKRDYSKFLSDKFIRIGIPWVIGVLFIAPPVTYLIYYTRDIPMDFFEFWTSDFWTKSYQQSVYWFLGVLLLFSMAFTLIHKASGHLQRAKPQISTPSWKLFTFFWLMMSCSTLLINQFSAFSYWHTDTYILVFQPVKMPVHIGFFILGIYAYFNQWFSAEGYKPRLLPWLLIWLASGALYLLYTPIFSSFNPSTVFVGKIPRALLFSAFCLSSLMAGCALFQQRVNGKQRLWRSLSKNSYGIYFIHSLILYPIAYFFVAFNFPLMIKAPLVILMGFLLSWAFSALILTRAPGIRRAFS